MLKRIIILLVSLLLLQIFFSCSSVGTTETNIADINKFWSESDSEVIADSIVNKLLLSEWKTKFTNKRKPKLVIGSIENLTNEKIDTDLLSKNIERSFINSGDVTFISSKDKREIVRSNRRNKNDFNGDKELKKYLKPLNSDFFISGNLKLMVDSVSVQKLKEYKLTLEIIKSKNLESVITMSEIIIKD
ncbi:MAG: penicillin-binding protein activator LpoB [Melioribacteraceae bacterium]|nr:penicillin-binding protein activator LpoB [Melioribacteraceae bacterium]